MSLLIRGGRLIDPGGADGSRDVLVENDRIAKVGEALKAPSDVRVIDAEGLWVIPGLVDFAGGIPLGANAIREARYAASSGITTLCVPPDGPLLLDDAASLRELTRVSGAPQVARVLGIGGLTVGLAGEGLTDMAALKSAGCAGVGNGRRWIKNSQVMRCAMRYAADLDLCVFITPRDPWLAGDGCAHAGRVATRLGLTGIPATAETAALARDLALVEDTGVRAHFGPLSCAEAVALTIRAQQAGLPVTADTTITHLFLTEMDVTGFNPACRLDPPLRSQEDRDALRAAVADGYLLLRSDHTPLPADAKMAPFPEAEPGASTLPTLLSLGIKLVQEDLLEPAALVHRLASGPAQVIGSAGGRVLAGRPADLIVVDPDAVGRCDPKSDQWPSAGRSTPFEGWEMPGRVVTTILDGQPTREAVR